MYLGGEDNEFMVYKNFGGDTHKLKLDISFFADPNFKITQAKNL